MATLYFTVEADWRKVLSLKEEITNLQSQLAKSDMGSSQWVKLNNSLEAASKQYNELCSSAARAGAEIEHKFNKQLQENQKELDKYSEKLQGLDAVIDDLGKQIKKIDGQRIKLAIEGDEKGLREMRDKIAEMKSLTSQRNELIALRNTTFSDKVKLESSNTMMVSAMRQLKNQSLDAAIDGKFIVDVLNMSKELSNAGSSFSSYLDEAQNDSGKLLQIFKDIASTASGVAVGNLASGGILAGYNQLEGIYHNAVKVRSEMEDVMSNMSAFLHSKEAADQFTSDLSAAAYFMTADYSTLVAGSKQLISYGNKVGDIIPILNKLGDVSVGTGNSLMGLIDLYNKAKAQGFISSQQQISWANQGIVFDKELAKLGMTKQGSKVTFEQMDAVLTAMTSKGGMFYNMQSEMMSNVSSMEGQLEDVMHNMYDEIGHFLQAPYNETLKWQISMAENWREIGTVIGGAVVAIGAYRTALVACKVAHEMVAGGEFTQKILTIADDMNKAAAMLRAEKADGILGGNEAVDKVKESLSDKVKEKAEEKIEKIISGETDVIEKNTAAKVANTAAETTNTAAANANASAHTKAAVSENNAAASATKDAAANAADAAGATANAASHVTLSAALKGCVVAAKEATIALLANPYTWIAVAVAGAAAAVWYFVTALSAEEEAQQDLEEATEAHNEAMRKEAEVIDEAIRKYKDKNETMYAQNKAYETLSQSAANYKDELIELLNLNPEEFEIDFKNWLDNTPIEDVVKKLQEAKEARERNNALMAADIQNKFAGGYTTDYRSDSGSRNSASHTYYDVVGSDGKVRSFANTRQDRAELFEDYFRPFVEATRPEMAEDEEMMDKYKGNLELMLAYLRKGSEEAMTQARIAQQTEEQEQAALRTRRENLAIQEKRLSMLKQEKILSSDISNGNFAGNDKAVQSVGTQFEEVVSFNEANAKMKLFASEANKTYEQYAALQMQIESETNAASKRQLERQAEALKLQFEQQGLLAGKWQAIKEKLGENTDIQHDTQQVITSADIDFGETPIDAAKKFWQIFIDALGGEEKDAEGQVRQLNEVPKTIKEQQKEYQDTYKTLTDIKNRLSRGELDFVKGLDLEQFSPKLKEKFDNIKRTIEEGSAEVSTTMLQEIFTLLGTDIGNAKTSYENSGGKDITGEKAIERQKARIRQMQDIENDRQQLARQQQDAMFKEQQNEINIMVQGAERQRAQRKLDHDKSMDLIQRQYEDELKKAKEAAKKRWETDQKNRSEEGKVGIFQDSYLSKDDIYLAAVKLADTNKNDKIFEEQTKFLGIDAIVAKYDKGKTEYAKAIGEMSVELDKLTEHRDALSKQFETADEKDKEGLQLKITYYNGIIDKIIERQKVMLDEAGKAREQFLKTYGSIYDQIGVIIAEGSRKAAESGSDEWTSLNILGDNYKSIVQAIEKNQTLSLGQRMTILNEQYLTAQKQLDDKIRAYHAQSLDEQLTDEQRADAQRLENATKAAKQRMAIENTQTVGKLSMESITKSADYFAAMQDPTLLSSQSLSILRERLEGARKELSNLDPKDLKVVTDLLDKILDVDMSRDPFKALSTSTQELSLAQADLSEKTAILTAERNKLADIEERLKVADEETKEALEAQRNDATQSYNDSLNAYENAVNRVISANGRLEKANTAVIGKYKEFVSGFRSIADAIAKAGGNGAELVGKISDIVADVMDGLIQAKEAADKMEDKNKLNIESANATKIDNAANKNRVTTDTQTSNVARYESATDRMGAYIDKMNANLNGNPTDMVGSGTPADKALADASKGDMTANLPSAPNTTNEPSKGQSAMNAAMSIMQGVQLGMSVGTKMWQMLESGVTGEAKYEKYAKKLAEVNQLTNSVNRYRMAAAAANKQEKEWFSTSGLSALQDTWDVASKARDAYYTKLNEKQAAYRDQARMDGDYLGNILVGSIAGAVTGFLVPGGGPWGAIVGGIAGGIAGATTDYAQQALGNSQYLKQQVAAINNLRIETQAKHRSFMGIGGQDQKTEDLRTWAKQKYGDDLFDKDGMINSELAKEILDTYSGKLQGETEATIRELMEISDQYHEYQEQLRDYVSSLYSPLVDNMVDAMWQWFDTGRDALYAFRESAADTFRGIMSDMMKTIILKKVVAGFQDNVEDLYDQFLGGAISDTSLIQGVTNLTNDLMSRYETQMPVLQSMMTNMANTFESLGIDLNQNGGTSSGSSKVAANVTQDSIDEANGRMMAMQMILQGIWNDIIYYGDQFTKQTDVEAVAVPRRAGGRYEEEEVMFVDYTPAIDSIVSLKQTELQQQLAIHSANMNAIGGIAEQIADSYLELQGIHDDTTAMNKVITQMKNQMNDWEQYIKKI